MKLYAVKCDEGYLRKKENRIELVSLDKASVFTSLEDSLALRASYGSGKIAELILSEVILDL